MTFRTRVLFATAPVVLVPLLIFGLGVRRLVRQHFAAQYRTRVTALIDLIGHDLQRQGQQIAARLAALRDAAAADNRLRLAAVQGSVTERPYLLDYAATAMRLAGLDMLQIQDDSGRILSSGHFRNEFDRAEPALQALLPAAPNGLALVRARTAGGEFTALACLDTLTLADRRFTLVGGLRVDAGLLSRLARDTAFSLSLVLPADTLSAGSTDSTAERVVSELPVPFVDESRPDAARLVEARLVVAVPLAGLREIQHSVDLWFVAAVLVTVLVSLLLAGWLASRVSRPLAELAGKTAAVDVDDPAGVFASDRDDEIGTLERLLGEMTERLRAGSARLREAERRASMGELARQVNHDIKNSVAPLRNVLRHLAQVARDRPADLPRVFAERRQTLAHSLEYLEKLAANYARLSPETASGPCDVNAVAREAVGHVTAGAAEVSLQLADDVPALRVDALAVRRILENLVSNAVESLGGQSGVVTVSTSRVATGGGPAARVIVEDTGKGMTERELERAFEDFYTTKPTGTGLGLSVVRRLVTDARGRLRVETSPGAGSRFIVEIPADEGNA
jgi:signal transduction histidine kinase